VQKRRGQHTGAIIPRARALYVDLARRVMESHRYQWDDRDWVLPVVYMLHISFKPYVNKIGESLVADTRHAILANHLDGHARGEVQSEEYAEGVADEGDG